MAAALNARDTPRNLDPPETSDRAGRERFVRTAGKGGTSAAWEPENDPQGTWRPRRSRAILYLRSLRGPKRGSGVDRMTYRRRLSLLRNVHSGTAGFGQTDRDRLLGRPCAVLALPHVVGLPLIDGRPC